MKPLNRIQKIGLTIIESWQWSVFMAIVTVYTLFMDDLWVIIFPKSIDDFWYFLTCLALALFSFEIIVASYVKRGYLGSFFFWLDVLATLSMIFDIGWLMDAINSLFSSSSKKANNATSVAKTSWAARVTRIVRLVRLVRLVWIVKLYK